MNKNNLCLFIDDERDPPRDNNDWIIARSMQQTIDAIIKNNNVVYSYISFDHDLGDNEPTGYDIAKWIVEMDMDGMIFIPQDFSFYVHSQNVCGAKNIKCYLNNYLTVKRTNV